MYRILLHEDKHFCIVEVAPDSITMRPIDTGGSEIEPPLVVTTPGTLPAITITATPQNISEGGSWTLEWRVKNATSYADSDASFTWEPALPNSGDYEVYAWWTYYRNRSDAAPYRIVHDTGTAEVIVNQQDERLAGQWNLLGTYRLTAGVDGQVTIFAESGQANADAVRFIKLTE